jgi:type II secretory pathway pseudopilin PulG
MSASLRALRAKANRKGFTHAPIAKERQSNAQLVRGFTLVEVLVAAALLITVISALFLTLSKGELFNDITSKKADLQAKARRILDWVAKDVRQTNLIQINTNSPSADYIKFKQVTGIDNTTGNYTLSTNYIEYSYDSASDALTRNEVDDGGVVLNSWPFDNITQSPFYSDAGVPLAAGAILTSKKLVIVISSRDQVRGSLPLTVSLTEEIKIRNE